MKQPPPYVYSMRSARNYLRNRRSIHVFLPYSGRLMKVTKSTFKKCARKFKVAQTIAQCWFNMNHACTVVGKML